MGEVVAFPGHKQRNCSCGATTTDCPGEPMSGGQIDAVYEGVLDYRREIGWVFECSPHSPAANSIGRHM